MSTSIAVGQVWESRRKSHSQRYKKRLRRHVVVIGAPERIDDPGAYVRVRRVSLTGPERFGELTTRTLRGNYRLLP